MLRSLSAELIDTLPHNHPDAARSRRDLVCINRAMGNWRWLATHVAAQAPRGGRVLEIGAGGGEFAAWWDVRRSRFDRDDLQWAGLDLAPRPTGWAAGRPWFQTDLVAFDGYDRFDVVIANLTLHHFVGAQLAQLGARLRCGPRLVFVTEPARRPLHLWQARALALIGANRVTRHDAPRSVTAGFIGHELPAMLGLDAPEWEAMVALTLLGAYRMAAAKNLPR